MNTNEFISAGIFLVKPWFFGPLKDDNGLLAIKNDAVGLKIGFTPPTNATLLEWDFWIPSPEYTKLSQALDIEKGKPIGSQIINKQLWMCVREVHTESGITYEPFDWIKCVDPEIRPLISGDPIQHPEGKPLGIFVEHYPRIQADTESSPLTHRAKEQIKELERKKRLEEGRKIIDEVKNKKSVEDFSDDKPTTEEDPWANM